MQARGHYLSVNLYQIAHKYHKPFASGYARESSKTLDASNWIAYQCLYFQINIIGEIRISEPLPLLYSSRGPASKGFIPCLRRWIALSVIPPTSKTTPWDVQYALNNHLINLSAISSRLNPEQRESAKQNVSELSSDHVPGGWLCVPKPFIWVIGFFSRICRETNSTGTPSESPTHTPIKQPSTLSFS